MTPRILALCQKGKSTAVPNDMPSHLSGRKNTNSSKYSQSLDYRSNHALTPEGELEIKGGLGKI